MVAYISPTVHEFFYTNSKVKRVLLKTGDILLYVHYIGLSNQTRILAYTMYKANQCD